MTKQIPLLAFTIAGPMGHFRKFYSNTSALTYPFPPHTTLMGLIAGLLGEERDTYYETLASERLWIAVRMSTPVRIRTYTVNYLFTKNNKIYDKGQGTQIPVGWVLPRPPARVLHYRVYISTPDISLWERLRDIFSQRRFHWPPYLGITEALAWIERDVWVGEVPYCRCEEPILLGTPVICHPKMKLRLDKNQTVHLLLDRFTLDMCGKPYRSPRKTVEILYEAEGRPFRICLPYPVFPLPGESGKEEKIFGAFFREDKEGTEP